MHPFVALMHKANACKEIAKWLSLSGIANSLGKSATTSGNVPEWLLRIISKGRGTKPLLIGAKPCYNIPSRGNSSVVRAADS